LTVITHPARAEYAVIPVTLEKLYSFQGPRKRRRPDWPPVSQNSTACEAPATRACACVYPAGFAGGHRQVRSTLLGPGRSSRRVVQLEGGSGAPILEASLERR